MNKATPDQMKPSICACGRRYVDCQGMAKAACDAVRDGRLQILPAEFIATWFRSVCSATLLLDYGPRSSVMLLVSWNLTMFHPALLSQPQR